MSRLFTLLLCHRSVFRNALWCIYMSGTGPWARFAHGHARGVRNSDRRKTESTRNKRISSRTGWERRRQRRDLEQTLVLDGGVLALALYGTQRRKDDYPKTITRFAYIARRRYELIYSTVSMDGVYSATF